jgi:hypothetical protein
MKPTHYTSGEDVCDYRLGVWIQKNRAKAASKLVAVLKTPARNQSVMCTATVLADHDIDKMLTLIQHHVEFEKK